MAAVRPGPATIEGLRWLAGVGPSSLGAWGVAMGWGERAVYSHAQRLRAAGWISNCARTRGDGSLVYATRSGVRFCGVRAAVLQRPPSPVSWPHCDASAWASAWLTARGRGVLGPREMMLRREFRGELRWRERGEFRRRGHRPDLGGRLPDGTVLPIEVELSHKSPARLDAVLALHADWIANGTSPAVMYICAGRELADRVRERGEAEGLSVDRGTLRVDELETIRHEATKACGLPSVAWHLNTEVA